jgi:hypothetical protein
MTAAEKKAMRDEIDRKKKAAKKKKAEAERMRKLAEEAEMEKGRGTSNMHQMFAIINYVWGLYVHTKIIIVTDAKKHNMKRDIECEISVQH